MSVTITHRVTGAAIYAAQGAKTMAEAVERAARAGAYLRDANLRDADLRGANLQEANLQGADLQGAYLRAANLRGADLRGADLQSAYLRGAGLLGANLEGANLRGADLQSADVVDAGEDSRGYRFLAQRHPEHGYMVRAGCRYLTPVEAAEHWGRRHLDTPELRAEILAKLALMDDVARARGWL